MIQQLEIKEQIGLLINPNFYMFYEQIYKVCCKDICRWQLLHISTYPFSLTLFPRRFEMS